MVPSRSHQALHVCGAHRIGHGCRLREDGDLLHYVNDHRIALECCPSSNVQTGAIRDLASHPIKLYKNLGLRVTVNTDNRLVTNTTVSKELWLCHTQMGFTFDDLKQVILSGFKSAFLPFHVKQQYLRRVSEELDAFVHEQADAAESLEEPGSRRHRHLTAAELITLPGSSRCPTRRTATACSSPTAGRLGSRRSPRPGCSGSSSDPAACPRGSRWSRSNRSNRWIRSSPALALARCDAALLLAADHALDAGLAVGMGVKAARDAVVAGACVRAVDDRDALGIVPAPERLGAAGLLEARGADVVARGRVAGAGHGTRAAARSTCAAAEEALAGLRAAVGRAGAGAGARPAARHHGERPCHHCHADEDAFPMISPTFNLTKPPDPFASLSRMWEDGPQPHALRAPPHPHAPPHVEDPPFRQ